MFRYDSDMHLYTESDKTHNLRHLTKNFVEILDNSMYAICMQLSDYNKFMTRKELQLGPGGEGKEGFYFEISNERGGAWGILLVRYLQEKQCNLKYIVLKYFFFLRGV